MIARISEQFRGRRLAALALIVAGALALAGCADGQRAQTAIETPAVDGVGASVGPIDIRNLSVAAPSGGAAYLSATLLGAIINNSGTDDELVSVTTESAASVAIFESSADESAAADRSSSAVAAAQSSAAAAASAAAASAASAAASSTARSTSTTGSTAVSSATSSPPSPSASTPDTSAATNDSASPASTGTLDIPAGKLVRIGGSGGAVIRLVGLAKPLQGASQISITFTFKNAGRVTVTIAVHVPTSPVSAPTLPTNLSSAG